MRLRRLFAAASALTVAAAVLTFVPSPASAALTQRGGWPQFIGGARFQWSSPAIGVVNGIDAAVVGGMNGVLYAFRPDGSVMWAPNLGQPIASSPAIGDIDGDGANEVVVGFGTEAPGSRGGVVILNGNGGVRCRFDAPLHANHSGVWGSPAIGDVNGDGVNDIVFASFNNRIYAMNGGCGVMADFDNRDTVWSSPALRDVDNDGAAEIFIGGDQERSVTPDSWRGGSFRSLEYNGTGTLHQRWLYKHPETIYSGTAFAVLGGRLAVVTGSGRFWCLNREPVCDTASRQVLAFDPNSGAFIPGWPKTATYQTFLGGPAVGDVDGDGSDDVVIASADYRNGGSQGAVDAFLGNGGRWTWRVGDEIPSSPIIVDTTGGGTPEVVVGAAGQLFVLDGRSGNVVQQGLAAGSWAHKSAAAAGPFGGSWAVVTAGFDPTNGTGKIAAFTIPNPASAPWPQYQKNARRLGSDPTDPRPIRCDQGYWLVASDGGVFAFGPQAPFYGSTGNLRLNQPIVGMSSAPNRSGYRFVATDGGIFSFNAPFFGSTGALRLNSPIVGMAARPQGDGYWLVAADGGIFAFGNARFHGSMGGTRLNQPIVGMASTASGNGYWLVARDGGIFSFGDATFMGSTGNLRLNQPIVGMAARPQGDGYWFVAADGGVFSFGRAGFHGSTGHLRLNRPVVGMRPTPSGNGYWFVATDGGIFSFGDAEFCGSTGNLRLNQPIVGMG